MNFATTLEQVSNLKDLAGLVTSQHSTSWIGRTNTVPVKGFELETGRAIYIVETPRGDKQVWVTQLFGFWMTNVYDNGVRVIGWDTETKLEGEELATAFLTQDWNLPCSTCDGQGVCGTQPRDPQQQVIWDCPTCDGSGIRGSEAVAEAV